ncbi:hypothetical protein VN97_g12420 [Penicillium thymicola]|uniref:Uncharacterized protein n=1 Tax=Penicillium thymicola TaxID=293382 RepID=A0AAI9T6D1_PENTH|nr:hypothetical protein VN97_g12420 [Penicillium thymicola]
MRKEGSINQSENKEDKGKTIGQLVCYFPIQRFAARELKTQLHPAASSHLHLSLLSTLSPTSLPTTPLSLFTFLHLLFSFLQLSSTSSQEFTFEFSFLTASF